MPHRVIRRSAILSLLCLYVVSLPASAQDEPQNPVRFSVGYRLWYSKTSRLPTSLGIRQNQNGYFPLSGPVVSASYGNWGLSASYLFGSLDYSGLAQLPGTELIGPITMGSDREDLDIALSYRATSFLRPFVGYKYVHISVSEHIDTQVQPVRGTGKITLSGPTIGVNFLFRPFKEDQFFLTGTFFYGYGTLKVRREVTPAAGASMSVEDSENTYALNWDVAVGCRLNKSLMASVGYKNQYIPGTRILNDQSEEIGGLTLALILAF